MKLSINFSNVTMTKLRITADINKVIKINVYKSTHIVLYILTNLKLVSKFKSQRDFCKVQKSCVKALRSINMR